MYANPIVLRPFDAASKRAALAYGTWLTERLLTIGVTAQLFGSVELELAGKGEWEFALYPTDDQWYPTPIRLVNLFKSVYIMDDEFVLFNDRQDEHPIEIIVMRRGTAACNQAIMAYWRTHAAARATYEIVGTISQTVGALGTRRARYRGAQKPPLQHIATATASNLKRLVNWWNDVPLTTTQPSRFATLMAP